ncbi:MAG: hypothetical protein KBB94_10235 [Legionellaceae bacterium]|nr:hypothetical protein [Legionellaceae bacterium]MBP9776067.1 hypothetical protein [Legionellaceae bacterium]
MRYIVFEHYQAQAYQDFLKRLAVIESTLITARIDFDPGLQFSQIEQAQLPLRSRQAWCLYRIVTLLRAIVKGPVQETQRHKTLFPQILFYSRFNEALPELDACFKLLKQMGSVDLDHADSFLLGVLVWELLQALNPLSCSGTQTLWENLYHRSAQWQSAFTLMPKDLHSKLRSYFHLQVDTEKIILLERIRAFKFYAYLQTEVTPETIHNALNTLRCEIQRFYASNHAPVALNVVTGNMEIEHKKRVDILKFLQDQLVPIEEPISASLLEQHLNGSMIPILDCFDSPVCHPNPFSYLKPADKLKFIFDAIVFRPSDSVQSELGMLTVEVAKQWAPSWLAAATTHYLAPTSLGASYVHTKLSNHQFSDFNSNLYDSFTIAAPKKTQYQEDAGRLIGNLLLRLEAELVVKKNLTVLAGKISAYHLSKTCLSQQILDLIVVLNTRLEQIVQYHDCSHTLQQFEQMYRDHFGQDTLEIKCQQLHDQIEAITPLVPPELEPGSGLAKELDKVHRQLDELKAQNKIISLGRQFSELVVATQRFESQYQNEQAQFVFPNPNPTWRGKFPYVSLVALLLAAMGLAVAIGIMTGNPCFTFLVLPCLIDYTVPICVFAVSLGATVFLKSATNLSRYQFFGKTFVSQEGQTGPHPTQPFNLPVQLR